ncbi:CaiB/BaiF CoA-transferase family protein [soil metagenome]
MSGPLAGVRVIELAGIGPGPFCAMVLADLGADVLRIDRPKPGAPAPESGATGTPNAWDLLNRNRRGVAVNLRSPEGAAFVLEMAGQADVLVEGFRPGVAERMGLGPDDVLGVNPRVVYGRMTGWGQEGPMSPRAGHDLTYLALSGALAHIGRAGQPPTPPLNLVADFGGGGMLLAMGILAALVERGVSGQGQVVDAAMVDGAALLMAPLFGAFASGFWSAERGTNLLDSGAPFYDVYECSDGGWVAVGALEPQFYALLLEGLGLVGEGVDLPGQDDNAGWPILRARFTEAFKTKSRDEWVEVFGDVDACVAPVLNMGEAPGHPHAVARGSFPVVGGVPQPGPAPRFGRTPAAVPTPALDGVDPALVLEGWGVDVATVDRLRAEGVIG